jgi:hypothetical protein
MRPANLMIVATTATARREKISVNPLAKLNAAPEFLSKVNCKRVPITGCGSEEKFESAQVLVAKSKSQIVKAISQMVRVLPDLNWGRTLAPLFLLLTNHAERCTWKYLQSSLTNWRTAFFAHAITLGINASKCAFSLQNHIARINYK